MCEPPVSEVPSGFPGALSVYLRSRAERIRILERVLPRLSPDGAERIRAHIQKLQREWDISRDLLDQLTSRGLRQSEVLY